MNKPYIYHKNLVAGNSKNYGSYAANQLYYRHDDELTPRFIGSFATDEPPLPAPITVSKITQAASTILILETENANWNISVTAVMPPQAAKIQLLPLYEEWKPYSVNPAAIQEISILSADTQVLPTSCGVMVMSKP